MPLDIVDALKRNMSEIDAAKESISTIHDAMTTELQAQEQNAAKSTVTGINGKPTTPDITKQEMQAELEAQAANQRRASTVDYEELSNSLLQTVAEQGKLAVDKAKRAAELNTGNPLQQILGIVAVPYLSNQAQSHLAAAHVANDTLGKINQQMRESAITTAEIQTRVTEQTAKSAVEAVTADQNLKVINARLQTLATGADNVNRLLNLSKEQLNNAAKYYDVQSTEFNKNIALRNLALQEKSHADLAELRGMNIQLKEEQLKNISNLRKAAESDEESKNLAFELINQSLAMNGKKPIDASYRDQVLEGMAKDKSEQGEMYRNLYAQGMHRLITNGEHVQGINPVEAKKFRDTIGYTPNSLHEQQLLAEVDSTLAKGAAKATKANEILTLANQEVADKLSKDQENIDVGNNSFAKPATWATMAASEAFRNNKLFRNVISPQITENISTEYAAPAEIFKRVATAVQHKQASLNEATELLTMYSNFSVMMNNEMGLRKFTGLEQTRFIAKIPQPTRKYSGKLTTIEIPEGSLKSKLLPVGKVDLGALGTETINTLKSLSPMMYEHVDMRDPVKVHEALVNYVSGQLREPK